MALDRILFGDEGQPTGPQAAWMQGRENALYNSMRDFQRQQDMEKQQAELENARMGKEAYTAQVAAQREGLLAQQDYRAAQKQALLDKQEQEKQRIANANIAVLSDLYRVNPKEAERVLPQMRGSFSPQQLAILGDSFSPDLVHALARATDYTKGVQELRKTEGVEANKTARQDKQLEMQWRIANLNAGIRRELAQLQEQFKAARPESFDQLLAKNQRIIDAATSAVNNPDISPEEKIKALETLQAAKDMQLRAIQTKQALPAQRQQVSVDPATNQLAIMPTTVPQMPAWATKRAEAEIFEEYGIK